MTKTSALKLDKTPSGYIRESHPSNTAKDGATSVLIRFRKGVGNSPTGDLKKIPPCMKSPGSCQGGSHGSVGWPRKRLFTAENAPKTNSQVVHPKELLTTENAKVAKNIRKGSYPNIDISNLAETSL
jgi:hypothetical protein